VEISLSLSVFIIPQNFLVVKHFFYFPENFLWGLGLCVPLTFCIYYTKKFFKLQDGILHKISGEKLQKIVQNFCLTKLLMCGIIEISRGPDRPRATLHNKNNYVI